MADIWVLLVLIAGASAQNATVIEVLQDYGETVFLDLIETAGLTATLKGPGPFTVFSPRNTYLPHNGSAALTALKADPMALANIVKYHVIRGSVILRNDLRVNEKQLTTMTGQTIRLNYYHYHSHLSAQGVRMTGLDHVAGNGVVHLVHGLLRPANGSFMDILAANSDFSTLKSAIETAGIVDILNDGPLTLFAPNNQAFTSLGDATMQKLLAHPDILKAVLLYHVIPGTMYSAGIHSVSALHNLEQTDSERLFASVFSGRVSLDGRRVTHVDISATTGVMHVIDHVLIPSSVRATIASL